MKDYFKDISEVLAKIEVSARGYPGLTVNSALRELKEKIIRLSGKGGRLFLIGNGGSASIAGHIATDFLKTAHLPAFVLNDPSILTCFSNDYGYEEVFKRPLEILLRKGDMLIAISSSGRSRNILNAHAVSRKKECFSVTLSGFAPDNPLRKAGDFNFYVPSHSYGYVEIAHLAVCHNLVDLLGSKK